jgi:hypothetical protein
MSSALAESIMELLPRIQAVTSAHAPIGDDGVPRRCPSCRPSMTDPLDCRICCWPHRAMTWRSVVDGRAGTGRTAGRRGGPGTFQDGPGRGSVVTLPGCTTPTVRRHSWPARC